MQRGIFAALLLVGWFGVGLNFASAQFGTLGQAPIRPRPTVSPFINQGTGGGLSAFNYYGMVKPQTEAQRSLLQIQQALNPDGSLRGGLQQPQQQQQQTSGLGGLTTGHQATFFNYSHYYPNSPPMGNAAGVGTGLGFGGLGGFGGFGGLGGVGGFGGNFNSLSNSGLNSRFGSNNSLMIVR